MLLPAINSSPPALPLAPPRTSNVANTARELVVPPAQTSEPENSRANKTQPASYARQTNAQQLTENDYRVIAELKKLMAESVHTRRRQF